MIGLSVRGEERRSTRGVVYGNEKKTYINSSRGEV